MGITPAWPVASYLQDDRYAFRAPVPEDADHAVAWHEGAFPIDREQARKVLIDRETIPWGNNPTIRLMIVELATDTVVGGVLVERDDNRVSKLRITAGGRSFDEGQRIRVAVLRLLVPWVMDELDMMTTVIDVPADEMLMIDAARELGMVEAVRLREHIARPEGRVDLLMIELVNWQWGQGNA